MAGETIMSITYGLQVQPKDDPYIAAAERSVQPLIAAAVPGAFLVDTIPILKYVPEWMPFAGFKRMAKEWRKLAFAMADVPFEAAKSNIRSGVFNPSFTSFSLENITRSSDVEYEEYVIKSTASTMYIGASETTVAAVAFCILGLLTNPRALKLAQDEIDSVIGSTRLPSFGDEASLPYVMAIVKESLGWKNVSPTAGPHLLHVEDEYKGYRLPAGSIVIPNAWAILHDENTYPDPFLINPDRFIKDGKLNPATVDPIHIVFGFGRRICPGRHMALSAVWIAVASIIATFDLSKAVDDNGEIIEPTQECTSSLACMPLPFECSIKPRSMEAEALVRASVDEVGY